MANYYATNYSIIATVNRTGNLWRLLKGGCHRKTDFVCFLVLTGKVVCVCLGFIHIYNVTWFFLYKSHATEDVSYV